MLLLIAYNNLLILYPDPSLQTKIIAQVRSISSSNTTKRTRPKFTPTSPLVRCTLSVVSAIILQIYLVTYSVSIAQISSFQFSSSIGSVLIVCCTALIVHGQVSMLVHLLSFSLMHIARIFNRFFQKFAIDTSRLLFHSCIDL